MLSPKARPKAEACLYSMRCTASGPKARAKPEARGGVYSERLACWVRVRVKSVTPNPTTGTRTTSYAPNCWCACVGIFTPMRKRDKGDVTDGGCGGLRRVLRPTAAGASKGDVTDGGCGGLRRVLRTVAAGALEGRRYGRWLRELSKGDVTDGGCGSSRRVTLRTVAAGGCGGCRGRWLLAAVGRGARRSFPLPSAVAPPFVPSAAVGRGASLRPFRCRRP